MAAVSIVAAKSRVEDQKIMAGECGVGPQVPWSSADKHRAQTQSEIYSAVERVTESNRNVSLESDVSPVRQVIQRQIVDP